MKVYIYNQNCTTAGHSVPERILEQHDDPDNGGDWTVYEGTDSELRALALSEVEAAKTAGAGNDRYCRQVAKTLLDAIGLRADEISELVYGPEEA